MPDEATEFFAVFSRFEYALKKTGRLVRNDGRAEPNWTRFSCELNSNFFKEIQASKQVEEIFKHPPKKQIAKSGKLDWKPQGPAADAKSLFAAVCLIRNNLFHGGKFPNGPESEMSRNAALLREALWILKFALTKHPEVKAAFEEIP